MEADGDTARKNFSNLDEVQKKIEEKYELKSWYERTYPDNPSFEEFSSKDTFENNFSELKNYAGDECIYQYGLPNFNSYYNDAYSGLYTGATITFSHRNLDTNEGFCTCEFCRNFYNKYTAIQDYACKMNEANGGWWDPSYPNDELDYLIEGGDLDVSSEGDKAVTYLYEWEDSGNTYRIALYYDKATTSDNVKLVISRPWTEQEKNDKVGADNTTCSHEIRDAGSFDKASKVKVCRPCRKYVKDIVKSLKLLNDNDFETYIPYIARVVNSWFRDTYFIIPKNSDVAINDVVNEFNYKRSDLIGDNVALIENDDEFLKETGELWTKYVMYGDDYAVFLIDSQGRFFESSEDLETYLNNIISPSESDERQDDYDFIMNYIQKSYTSSNEEYFARWTAKTPNDIITDEDKEKYKEDLKADELLKKYNINYSKRSQNVESSSLGGSELNSSNLAWSAYGIADKYSKWAEAEITDSSPGAMQRVVENYNGLNEDTNQKGEIKFYQQFNDLYNIAQKRDAQRGITNSKIKYLFKNKKYYKYDGTVQRAYDINNDWEKCINLVDIKDSWKNSTGDTFTTYARSFLRACTTSFWNLKKNEQRTEEDFHSLKEGTLDSIIDNYYYKNNDFLDKLNASEGISFKFARDFNGDGIADIASPNVTSASYDGLEITEDTERTYDPRNPNLIDNIDLNLESLAAFSILENTGSADAEYAYRDLKELLVELDYFDKEDLVEPARDILEWLLPESGSAGWPNRTFDKNNDYGSLIHSKDMYDILDKLYIESEIYSTDDIIQKYVEIIQSFDGILNNSEIENEELLENLNFKLTSIENLLEKLNDALKDETIDEDKKSEYNEMIETYNQNKKDVEEEIEKIKKEIEEKSDKEKNESEARINYDVLNKVAISSRAKYKSGNVEYEEVTDPDMHCESITTINGVEYRNYKQGYPEWGSIPFSYGNMAGSACGATSCAVVLSGYGNDLTPIDTRDWIWTNFTNKDEQTSSAALVACLTNYGVPAKADYSSSHDEILNKIRQAWDEGKPVIANVGSGQITDNGHYIVILGEVDGKVVISQVGGNTYTYIEKGYLYADGDLETLYNKNPIKGIIIPDEAPTGFKNSSSSIQYFEGFEKNQPIVSPATAKVLEIGTVTVNNETEETVMKTFYKKENDVEDDTKDTDGEIQEDTDGEIQEDTDEKSNVKKTIVTENQFNSISQNALVMEMDENNPFGKEYTTGYVKLEVIGAESMAKFEALKDSGEISSTIYDGINAFYNEYYNETRGRTICDSYTIYIEGIDLTGELEEGGTLNDDLSNTILAKLFDMNSDDGVSFTDSGFIKSNDTQNTEEDSDVGSDTNSDVSDDESIEDIINRLDINYYTEKEIPEYYTNNAKSKIEAVEASKKATPSIIKFASEDSENNNGDIYLKAGTILGITGNANIKIIMKDKENSIVENVEDYLEIEDGAFSSTRSKRNVVDQEYEEDPDGNDVYRLAALMHHEYCADSGYISDTKVRDPSGTWVYAIDLEDGKGNLNDISKTCAYVVINRALLDGKKIADCMTSQAYGSAASGYKNANANSGNWCATCLENAEFCLTYDCGAVVSSEGIPMTRNCTTQSSFDVNCSSAWTQPNNLERWWLIDANGDGYVKDHHHRTSGAFDSFFLREKDKNDTYSAEQVPTYGSEVIPH